MLAAWLVVPDNQQCALKCARKISQLNSVKSLGLAQSLPISWGYKVGGYSSIRPALQPPLHANIIVRVELAKVGYKIFTIALVLRV
jgi:hypothetical protein